MSDLFPDIASTIQDVLRGGGQNAWRALPLAAGPGGEQIWCDIDMAPHPDVPGIVLIFARDVTDHVLVRRDAEDQREALEPTDARLRLAQEAAGIGTWEWDTTKDRQAWSPQQFDLHGLDPATARPPSSAEWLEMVHSDDRGLIEAACMSRFNQASDTTFQMAFRIHRRDTGAERWLLSLGRVTEREADGSPKRILGVTLDITDRRNKQAAEQQYQALLRLAAEAAEVFAWDWDLGTDKVVWGDGLEKAVGLPPGGFDGAVNTFRKLVHPDDAPAVEAALRRAIDGETAEYRATFRMIRPDGSVRWTQTRGTVIRDRGGRPLRLIGMDHDLTDIKATEASLRVREAQQAAVARLGHFALSASSSQSVMQEAVRVVTGTLAVELVKVLQLRPDGRSLLLRAGVGWSDAYPVGQAAVAAGRDSQAGYTLLRDAGPVIVDDLRSETRFNGPKLLRDHGVISGLSVVIRGDGDHPWGVLGAHTRQHRSFNEQDIWFLEAVANLITAAIQRERNEADLKEREVRLRLFIDRAPASIAMFDRDMHYLAVSRRYLSDYRLPFEAPADLIGRHHDDVFPGMPEAWQRVHRRVLAGETLSSDSDSFVRSDGQIEFIRWEMTPWHLADGAVGGLVLFTEVITARKEAEAALAESEARFRTAMQALPNMIYMNAADGISEYKSQRWFDYSGQTPEQARNDGWIVALHPDDRDEAVAAWDRAVRSGEVYEHEHRLRRKDGSYRWFLSRSVPMRDEASGRIVRWVGATTDISAIVEAREAAAHMAATLETQVAERTRALTDAAVELQAEMRRRQDVQAALLQSQKLEALGQLTAGVAHDFNNVLASIQGSFELIERRTSDRHLLQLLALGKNGLARGVSLTRQLLDFGRSESLTPAELDIEAVLNRANDLIGHAIGSDIRRIKDIEANLWPVLSDGHQLEIALLNLAINARDAMPNGGTLTLAARNLRPAERPATLALRDYVMVSVSDTGEGMPADVAARATEPFFTTKPTGKGTGLGLAMVQAFALRSGGHLRIDSRQGVGTTVQIILPRAAVSGMRRETTPALTTDSEQSPTILVVDDDEQVRQVIAIYLRDKGYTVLEAHNTEAAIVLSHSIDDLDMLVTDVSMPGAPGIELADRLRAERPQLPVLFITGHPGRADLAGEVVLPKPFTGADLVRAISRHISGTQGDAASDDGLVRRLSNPALLAAYLFWRAARNGDRPPRLPDLDWGGLPDAEHTFTVAVEPAAETLTFRYLKVGRALLARLGRPMESLNKNTDLTPDPEDEVLGSLSGAYRRCARTLKPSYEYARFDFGDGPPVLFERVILPVSNDGDRVTHLVGIAMFSGEL